MGILFGKSLEEELIDKQLNVRQTVRNIEMTAAVRAGKSETEISSFSQTIAQLILAKDDLSREKQYAIKLESRLMGVASHVELQTVTTDLEKLTTRVSKVYSEKRANETAINFNKSSNESLAADSKLQSIFSPSETEGSLANTIRDKAMHGEKIVLKQEIPSPPDVHNVDISVSEKSDDLMTRLLALKTNI
jgi:hypothetical protein